MLRSTMNRAFGFNIECLHPLATARGSAIGGSGELLDVDLLFLQPAKQAVDNRLAVLFVDGAGERNAHRAGLDAVLRVAAVCNAVFAHDSFEALVARGFAAGVHVE